MDFAAPGAHCTFRRNVWLDPWLTLIPYLGPSGRLAWRRANELEAYLAATGCVVIATGMRVALDKYIYGAQFFTFCLAVLGSTFVGGGCTGLFAVLLSTLSAWYFLVPPYTFTFLVQGEPITLLSFVAVGVVCVVLIASLQAAAITIADHRAHLATLEERLKAAEELHKWQEIFQKRGRNV